MGRSIGFVARSNHPFLLKRTTTWPRAQQVIGTFALSVVLAGLAACNDGSGGAPQSPNSTFGTIDAGSDVSAANSNPAPVQAQIEAIKDNAVQGQLRTDPGQDRQTSCPAPKIISSADNDASVIQPDPLGTIVSSTYATSIDRRRSQLASISGATSLSPEMRAAYLANVADIYKAINDRNLVDGFNANPSYNPSDNSIAGLRARRLWPMMDPMNPDKEATSLDLNAEVFLELQNLTLLAQAYILPITTSELPNGIKSYYQETEIKTKIKISLDYITNDLFSKTGTSGSNWWYNEIGNPKLITNIIYILLGDRNNRYANFSDKDIDGYLKVVESWIPDPARRRGSSSSETGANLADKAFIFLMTSLLRGDQAKVGRSAAILSSTEPDVAIGLSAPLLNIQPVNVKTNDGFYSDGGYIQHNYHSYLGNYGKDLIYSVTSAADLLVGTNNDIRGTPGLINLYGYIEKGIVSQIYNGALTRTSHGRMLSRQAYGEHIVGRWLIASLANLAGALDRTQPPASVDPATSDRIKSYLKGWMTRDTTFSYMPPSGGNLVTGAPAYIQGIMDPSGYYTMNSYAGETLWGIWKDGCVPAASEVPGVVSMPSIAKVFGRSGGANSFAVDIAMFSDSIQSFEQTNNENGTGWWGSLGTVYLHTADQSQFDGNFQPTVNLRRLPGTTTDGSGKALPDANSDLKAKGAFNTNAWAGASVLSSPNTVGDAAMSASVGLIFSTQNATRPSSGSFTPLTGNKSWFLFGDKIVALGSAINGGIGPVETIIENRRLSDSSSMPTLNYGAADTSQALSLNPGAAQILPAGVSWVSYADPKIAKSQIGYVFLQGSPGVRALLNDGSGTWSALDKGWSTHGDTVVRTNRYFSLAYQHGSNPANGAYAYVILPGRDASATQQAAAALTSRLVILRNDQYASAVADSDLGLLGANIWSVSTRDIIVNGVDGLPLITASNPASVTMGDEAGGKLRITIADPTRKAASVRIKINRKAISVIAKDDSVTLDLTTDPQAMILTVNTTNKAGVSQSALLQLETSEMGAGDTFSSQ
ncbi:polysaccharide lyase family 8 super-sandwich domain-containing protein [Labrys sp. 22185]|uniref:polysaccharide lyase family 8 super-sandwich domain-containing protein n=1 Tax=Labrys sp. 22185 TaxID=3453888 RepID=UPI003F826D32